MTSQPKSGYLIVLTTSRAEGSIYNHDPFMAFTNTFPHRLFPRKMLEDWFAPRRNKDGSAGDILKDSPDPCPQNDNIM